MIVLLIFLFLATALFFLLESAFESFSRISLAKFLKGYEGPKFDFDYVAKFDLAIHALSTFVFFLEMLLLAGLFLNSGQWVTSPWIRLLGIAALLLLVFHVVLYVVAYLNRERVLKALLFLFPLAWYAFYPVNRLLAIFLRDGAVTEDRENEGDDIGEEELEVFFEEGAKEGVIAEEDQEMLQSVLEFGDTLVREIMTPRVDMVYAKIGTGLDELVALVREKKLSRIPVTGERIDHIEGVVLSKDLFGYWNQERFSLREILRPPFFVPETMRILELLKEMQKSKQKFAIVIDEFGGVSGVVTMEDIMEEIVGDIKDEYDDDVEAIVREKDHFIVMGDTGIYELQERLETEFTEEDEYQTVAGLISYKLGKIPRVHDQVRIGDYVYEVLEVDKNRIRKVRIHHAQG